MVRSVPLRHDPLVAVRAILPSNLQTLVAPPVIDKGDTGILAREGEKRNISDLAHLQIFPSPLEKGKPDIYDHRPVPPHQRLEGGLVAAADEASSSCPSLSPAPADRAPRHESPSAGSHRWSNAKRRALESWVREVPRAQAGPATGNNLRPVLDEELSRLEERLRVAVVLCDLEGKCRKDAARQLGWPEGTLLSRLATARRLLVAQLARRGVRLSNGALAATLGEGGSRDAYPAGGVHGQGRNRRCGGKSGGHFRPGRRANGRRHDRRRPVFLQPHRIKLPNLGLANWVMALMHRNVIFPFPFLLSHVKRSQVFFRATPPQQG
jgi:hypothetical protein